MGLILKRLLIPPILNASEDRSFSAALGYVIF